MRLQLSDERIHDLTRWQHPERSTEEAAVILHAITIGITDPALDLESCVQRITEYVGLGPLIVQCHTGRNYSLVRDFVQKLGGERQSLVYPGNPPHDAFRRDVAAFMDQYVRGNRPHLQWGLPPSEISSAGHHKFYKTAEIPTLSKSLNVPCLLLHELGSFSADSELQSRVEMFFNNHNSCLCNASGSGKTRLLLEGLCQHWGFYWVCGKHSLDIASADLPCAIAWAKREPTFSSTLTGSPSDQHSQLQANRLLIKKLIAAVVLARVTVFNIFLNAVQGLRHSRSHTSTNYRKLWLRLQLDPQIAAQHFGLPPDIFTRLTEHYLTLAVKDVTAQATEALDTMRKHPVVANEAIYLVLDEVQDSARELHLAFRNPHAPSTSDDSKHPLLWELIRALSLCLSRQRKHEYIVLSGTSLTAHDVASAIDGLDVQMTANTVNKSVAVDSALGGYQDEEDRDNELSASNAGYGFVYIGGFDNLSAVKKYTAEVVPGSLLKQVEWSTLEQRMFKWLRGRFRFIVDYLIEVLVHALTYPHQVLDEYVFKLSGIMPSDGHIALVLSRTNPALSSLYTGADNPPSMIAITTPNAIDLAKLYDHATMQGRLIQDVRVAVFEFMLRKKRNSIAGAGYSQDIVKMGVARYTEADGTHEVTISKHADKASKNRGTVPSEMGVVPSETERPADISEPLVLLALSHHFDTWSPGLYTMHHFCGQRIPGDGNKFNGWENYIAIAVLRAFSGDESPELSRFLRFHTKGCDVDALKKKRARVVGVFRASGLDLAGEFTDNTRPGHDARRESETRRSRRTWCHIGEETKSPTETLRWFDNPTSTVCYPDTSLGPDLAFRLLLDGNELVWLLIQCKYHVHGGSNSKGDNLVSKSELTKDAVRKVTPNCFYKTKPESREDAAERAAREAAEEKTRDSFLASLKRLPCATSLAGTYSVIRVLAYIPTYPTLVRPRSKIDDPDDGNHPLAELKLDELRGLLKDFEPTDAMADTILMELSKLAEQGKLANFHPPSTRDKQQQYNYAWNYYLTHAR
ncbi:hypothetical protein EV715DRAFT_262979 [Schizophyllum commune]